MLRCTLPFLATASAAMRPSCRLARRIEPFSRAAVTMSTTTPKPGSLVSVSFTLASEGGDALPEDVAVFDQGDVRLVVGAGGFIPGLHKSIPLLETVGKEQTFKLSPAECFGDANPNLGPITVPKEQAPPGLAAGDRVRLSNGLKARVTAIDDEGGVTIDANHPFAGQPLELTAMLKAEPVSAAEVLREATFAAGCFWGVELAYQRQPGVITTEVGYTQGELSEPTYEAVCSGATGHTEAIRLQYDPNEVSYEELCALFWDRLGQSRYLLNQVGNDRGTQYRHGIYPHDEEQMAVAAASLKEAEAEAGGKTIHTEICKATKFWPAEDYHQQYLQKGGQSARKKAEEEIRCYG